MTSRIPTDMVADRTSKAKLSDTLGSMQTSINTNTSSLADIVTVSVKNKGAKGDGITDDTFAIQSAISSLTNGGILYFPSGNYGVLFSNKNLLNYAGLFYIPSNVTIRMHPNAKIVVLDTQYLANDHNGIFVVGRNASGNVQNVKLESLSIVGMTPIDVETAGNMPIGIYIAGMSNRDEDAIINNVMVENSHFTNLGSAVLIQQTVSNTTKRQTWNVTVKNCKAEGCVGSFVTADGNNINIHNNTASGYVTNPAIAYDAISVHCGQNVKIQNNTFSDYGIGQVINIRNSDEVMCGTSNVIVSNNLIMNCPTDAISIANHELEQTYGVTDIHIIGNKCTNTKSGVKISVSQTGTASPFTNFSVIGNNITATTNGIYVLSDTSRIVRYVSIKDNDITMTATTSGYGLYIQYVSRFQIHNNRINNLVNALGYKSAFIDNASYTSFCGNHAWVNDDTQSVVNITNSDYFEMTGNFIRGLYGVNGLTHAEINANNFTASGTHNSRSISGQWEQHGSNLTSRSSASPTTGAWIVGDIVLNTAPSASGYMGWVCTTAGTPGTWKGYGAISA